MDNLIVWFGSLLFVILSIRKITKDADKDLEPSIKDDLALALLSSEESGIPKSWFPNFKSLFDRVFGYRHLSFLCFLKSSFVSLLFYLFLFFIFIDVDKIASRFDLTYWVTIMVISFVCGITNFIPDYISLFQTRLLLNSRLSTFTTLFLDLLLTGAIILFWVSGITLIHSYATQESSSYISELKDNIIVFRHFFFWPTPDSGYSAVALTILIPSATTFFTSIWLWLHGLSELTISLLSRILPVVNLLNVVESPIRAIGIVTILLVVILWAMLLPVALIVK